MEENLNLTENEQPLEQPEGGVEGGVEGGNAPAPVYKKNKAALIAAILGAAAGILFIAFSLLFFAGVKSFDTTAAPEDEQLGAALGFIFVIVLFMIPIMLVGLIAGILETARALFFLSQVSGKRASSLGVLIGFTVLKVVYCIAIGYCAFIYASFGEFINPLILYPGMGCGFIGIICSIVGNVFGFKARKFYKKNAPANELDF